MTKKQHKPKKKRKTARMSVSTPRQARLKGMEDNAIQDLEDGAIAHSELRTEMAAARADFKERLRSSEDSLVALMRKNQKKTYNHAGIKLKLREGQDSVSVQVKRHDVESSS